MPLFASLLLLSISSSSSAFAAPIEIEIPTQPAVTPEPGVLNHNGMIINFGNGTTSYLMKECDPNGGSDEKVDERSCRFCLADKPETCFSHTASVNMDRMMTLHRKTDDEREEDAFDDRIN